MAPYERIPRIVLDAYRHLGVPQSVEIIQMGLINHTYVINTDVQKFVLQELSPIFETAVIDDSDAVSRHLIKAGIDAPRHLITIQNDLYIVVDKRVFRALKYIEGRSFHTIKSLDMAESSGKILGKFHRALIDFDYRYRSQRRHGGDYSFHRANLIAALKEHPSHDYFSRVSPLAQKMLKNINEITWNLTTTARHVHGDPKISNIIFDAQNQAVCLIDFDTLGKTGWSLELGDALRSWCNPNKEDVLEAFVDLEIARAALKGYGEIMRGHMSEKEVSELVTHSQAITLCLAIRYLTDVVNERYWAYDQQRFTRAAEHNWLRARAMYELFIAFLNNKNRLFEMARDFLL